MTNETIPYVTRNLRHLLAAPNLTETQRTIITRTLATLSEMQMIAPVTPLWSDAEIIEMVSEIKQKYNERVDAN